MNRFLSVPSIDLKWLPRHLATILAAAGLAVAALPSIARAEESETIEAPSPKDIDVRRDATVIAVEKALPSVVNIETTALVDQNNYYDRWRAEFFGYGLRPPAEKPVGAGSGVVVDEDGYIITNVHVIRGAKRIFVKFNDDSEPLEAERVALSAAKDVALLRIKAPKGKKFRSIKFAKDDDLLLGETVVALGNPFGFSGSVSRGILSSKNRRGPGEESAEDDGSLGLADWLQTDAAINPGNSGGPLINLRGELIGINVAVLRPNIGAQGIGFAIPVRRLNEALAEVLSGDSVGKYWFGARLKPALKPLTVDAVAQGSPAARAGLKRDDVILTVNGDTPKGIIEFNRSLVAAGDDQTIKLVVRRDGARRELELRLVEETDFFNNNLIRRRTGMTLQPARGGGFVIGSVDRGTPAAIAGLQPGLAVLAVDGIPMTSLASPLGVAKHLHNQPVGATIELGLVVTERSAFGYRQYEAAAQLKLR
jgi:serine protease Do